MSKALNRKTPRSESFAAFGLLGALSAFRRLEIRTLIF
jgi:hypothetical protein